MILATYVLALSTLGSTQTYTDRTTFLMDGGDATVHAEDFDSVVGPVSSLFDGLVQFQPQFPTVFFGAWFLFPGCYSTFAGGGLISEPRFQSSDLVLQFSEPVLGVGAQAYDDGDGSPAVNVIELSVTTVTGATISVNESCGNYGDTGFLGVIASEQIVEARFSISGSGGNLEIDDLVVLEDPSGACGFSTYGEGASPANLMSLDGGGETFIGGTFEATTTMNPGTFCLTAISTAEAQLSVAGGVALVDPDLLVLQLNSIPVAGSSTNLIPIPNNPALVGLDLFFQSFADDGSQTGGLAFSNGLALTICQ